MNLRGNRILTCEEFHGVQGTVEMTYIQKYAIPNKEIEKHNSFPEDTHFASVWIKPVWNLDKHSLLIAQWNLFTMKS